jgi:hypothetical protein
MFWKKSITEDEAGYRYMQIVMERASEDWQQTILLFINAKVISMSLVRQIIDPVWKFALPIIGSNLHALVYSPIFKDSREQADRLETWALYNILKECRSPVGWTSEDLLRAIRMYQAVDHEMTKQHILPFGQFAKHLLKAWFPNDTNHFCVGGGDVFNEFWLTVVGDILAISSASCFRFWKDIGENYKIKPSKLPEGFEEILD